MKNYLFLLSLIGALWSCTDKPDEAMLEQSVRDALDVKDYETSETKAKELLQHYPKSAAGLNMLGFTYLQVGQTDLADSALTLAVNLDTTNWKYFFNAGNAANIIAVRDAEPEDFLKAHVFYSRAINLNDTIPQLFIYRSVMINNLTDFPNAVNDLKRSMELDPNIAQAHYLLGRTYRNLAAKDSIFFGSELRYFTEDDQTAYRDSAIASFQNALNLAPSDYESLHWLGMTFMENGVNDKACEAWVMAKETGSVFADLNLHLNCSDYTDEHTDEEIQVMIDEFNEKVKDLEEGEIMEGDGLLFH